MTPHISAKIEDIASSVIMPGDPKRAKFIAENYLTNPKLVNEVRGILAYTGTYKNKEVTVMASGMGMPSIAIYSYELFNFYNVENIIRLGSCKSLNKEIDIKDIILAEEAYTLSNFAYSFNGEVKDTVQSSRTLNAKVKDASKTLDLLIFQGKISSSDVFYSNYEDKNEIINNCIGLEMETFALLYIAKYLNKQATAVLTVSDNIDLSKKLTPEEREKSFNNSIKLVLEALIK